MRVCLVIETGWFGFGLPRGGTLPGFCLGPLRISADIGSLQEAVARSVEADVSKVKARAVYLQQLEDRLKLVWSHLSSIIDWTTKKIVGQAARIERLEEEKLELEHICRAQTARIEELEQGWTAAMGCVEGKYHDEPEAE